MIATQTQEREIEMTLTLLESRTSTRAYIVASPEERRKLLRQPLVDLLKAVDAYRIIERFCETCENNPRGLICGVCDGDGGQPESRRVCSSCDGRGRVACGDCEARSK